MNRLFILRAAPATGKSTWVESNGLEDITVSSDAWRIKLNGLVYDEDGNPSISQERPWLVWGKVKDDIEERMKQGEDIILDSCALKTKDMNAYAKLIDEYGYEAYVVEFFHDVDAEICKQRNREREAFRFVPEYVIDRFFEEVEKYPVPEYMKAITPDEAIWMLQGC